MLSGVSFTEERIEWVITIPDGRIAGHLTVGLDAVFQAVQLPARISHLNTSLANVDWDTFALQDKQHARSLQVTFANSI